MPVNADKPHLWKPDIALSVDFYNNPKSVSITGSQALSLGINVPRLCLAKIEAEPPDLRYQALPGNE